MALKINMGNCRCQGEKIWLFFQILRESICPIPPPHRSASKITSWTISVKGKADPVKGLSYSGPGWRPRCSEPPRSPALPAAGTEPAQRPFPPPWSCRTPSWDALTSGRAHTHFWTAVGDENRQSAVTAEADASGEPAPSLASTAVWQERITPVPVACIWAK